MDLSTTRGGGENSSCEALLGRFEIEVFEDGARPAVGKSAMVAFEQDDAVAEDAIGEPGRGLVEQDHVDVLSRGRLEIGDQATEIEGTKLDACTQPDRDV